MSVTITLEELKTLLIGDNSCQSESQQQHQPHQGPSHSFVVGNKYLIRTVTFYYTGLLESVTDSDLVLSKAAWIPDTGRFHDCLKNGSFGEVEPFTENVIIPRGGIIDATIWKHSLPETQK